MEVCAAAVGTKVRKDWYEQLRKICDENNILIIGDSVMGGWKGKMGGLFKDIVG